MNTRVPADPAAEVRKLLREKWPEATCTHSASMQEVFCTGVKAFNALFPDGGVPFGQWLEINGASGSGKTGFLFAVLSSCTEHEVIAYLDFPGQFFPAAAQVAGLDLKQMRVLVPQTLHQGLRTAEILLTNKQATVLVFDLVNQRATLPQIVVHRLRQQVLQTGALVFLLTEPPVQVVGSSTVALRLAVTRDAGRACRVHVVKSRLGVCGRAFSWSPGG